MRTLIVANGADLDPSKLREQIRCSQLVIITDGAAHKIPTDYKPHIILGDFDSIDLSVAKNEHTTTEFMHLSDQDYSGNDLEKAITVAIERGATEILILGGFGGRLDQSLATVSIKLKFATQVKISSYHEGTNCWIVTSDSQHFNPLTFSTKEGQIVSLMPLTQGVLVTAQNLKWPLNNESLFAGSRGVSNIALGGEVKVVVSEGVLVVCHME